MYSRWRNEPSDLFGTDDGHEDVDHKNIIKNTMVQDATADKKIWCLCGSLCTTSDILCREVEFDHLEIGDTLAFENVGAYSVTEGFICF